MSFNMRSKLFFSRPSLPISLDTSELYSSFPSSAGPTLSRTPMGYSSEFVSLSFYHGASSIEEIFASRVTRYFIHFYNFIISTFFRNVPRLVFLICCFFDFEAEQARFFHRLSAISRTTRHYDGDAVARSTRDRRVRIV